ncbi:MAG: sulfurtransferase [Proteobacteria bacterium]|nr:sulfurtransferase [Pseudomonadota bacterium]
MHSTLIDTATLAAHLDDPTFIVVDVRHDLGQPDSWGPAQYAAGHVPGAQFASIDADLSAPKTGRNGRHPLPAPDVAATLFGRMGIGPGTQVVAYDQGQGMFASRLWWMLRWLGHDAAAVLDGGFAKWTAEGRAIDTARPAPRATGFVARTPLPTASVQDVLDSLASRSRFIVDARAPERYRGDVEPIDPVAGHIPGAHNWPYARNVNADGTFRPAAELRSAFSEFLGPTPTARVVHQCGSGVTACHNVLAMAHAGYPLTTLYPGSWSEWVADPSRPVAKGAA